MNIGSSPHAYVIHGLRRRWMANSVLLVLLVIIVIIFTFAVLITNYYYSTMSTGLEAKAREATSFFGNYITRAYSVYYDSIYSFTQSFDDSSRLELQFIDTDGRVIISSSGITAGTTPGTPDISEAIETGEISVWTGKSVLTGERVMTVSAPILYSDDQIVGVMRYVTSLKLVDRQILINILIALGLGALVLAFVIFTNMLFIKSVVEPIGEITQLVKRIAEGSYGIQIGNNYKDEIGDMVESINEMSMKIAKTEKIQTEFVSSVSHELRTPLTAITGWGETLIYDENLDSETKRGISIILKEARRLTKLVEELLEFTRMQDGRFTLNIEQIDVEAELEDSIFTYRELLHQDEIELTYEPYLDELPLIPGDPARLRQVFLNLLDNAAKYGREGKRIVVSIGADSSDVIVRIRDFGPGIPEDEIDNVKMKFYKGSSSKERGSGIGLAVCDEIIKYHGGRLSLENAEGGGLLVTIRLPISTSV